MYKTSSHVVLVQYKVEITRLYFMCSRAADIDQAPTQTLTDNSNACTQTLLYNYMLHTAYEIQRAVAAVHIPAEDEAFTTGLKSHVLFQTASTLIIKI